MQFPLSRRCNSKSHQRHQIVSQIRGRKKKKIYPSSLLFSQVSCGNKNDEVLHESCIWLILFQPLIAFVPQGFTIKEPRCLFMASAGPCENWVKVWGYDYLTNRCIFFYYGGCGGNPNRFYTKDECLSTCRVYRDPKRKKREDIVEGEEEEEEEEEEEQFEEDIDNWDSFENWEL